MNNWNKRLCFCLVLCLLFGVASVGFTEEDEALQLEETVAEDDIELELEEEDALLDIDFGQDADMLMYYKDEATAYLDINGWLDGEKSENLGGRGTVDVYINGSMVADNVNDYYMKWPVGTSYEIKDIKAKEGYEYTGVHSGSLFGTVGSKATRVVLCFDKEGETAYLDVNGWIDGKKSGNLGNRGTVDVYINGNMVADNVNDYYMKWPVGTSYEIKDIKAKAGYAYTGVHSGALSGKVGPEATRVVLCFDKEVKPTKVKLNKTKATVVVGGTLELVASITPSNAKTTLTWTSSNKKVATVNSSGLVKGIKSGTVTITVKTANGKKASCKVSVKAGASVTHRALLIGQVKFAKEVCNRNSGDVKLMAKMLSKRKGAAGGYYKVTKKYDLSAESVFDAINSTFGSAKSNDVSLFFIATHGDSSSSGINAGALAMPSGEFIRLSDLASALKKIPGTVIVILESCGSGAAVYANGKEAKKKMEKAAKVFDEAVVKAFSDIDPGLYIDSDGNTINEGDVVSNTGEFRKQNKFYVLTASRYQEDSWGSNNFNLFTKWLTDGIGTSGKMKADTNKDTVTTLNELYKYISKVGDNHAIPYKGKYYYQHVQVYPSNSSYKLFRSK